MMINIKFKDTPHDDDLRSYAEQKVGAFSKFLSAAELDATVCDIEFRHSTHHQNGDVCYAEITLEVAGKVYRAEKSEPTLEKAIDKVKDDILQALRSDKERQRHNFIKGATKAKEMLKAE